MRVGKAVGSIPAIAIGTSTLLVADQCKGQVIYSSGENTLTLPPAEPGLSLTIYSVTANIQTVAPGAGKRIILDGVSLGDGVAMASDGTIGALVTLHADSEDGWTVVGKDKVWA